MMTFQQYICEVYIGRVEDNLDNEVNSVGDNRWFKIRDVTPEARVTTELHSDNFIKDMCRFIGQKHLFTCTKEGWWKSDSVRAQERDHMYMFHRSWLEPVDVSLYEAIVRSGVSIEDDLSNESKHVFFRVRDIKPGSIMRMSGVQRIDFGLEKARNIGRVLAFEPVCEVIGDEVVEGWWNYDDWFYHESWLEPV